VGSWFARHRTPTVTALTPTAAYQLWAPSYPPEPHNALMRAEQMAVIGILPDVVGRTGLDAGCGTGRYTRILEARGAAAVVGVDLTPEMLVRARGSRALIVRGDLCALPLASASVDVAVCGLALNDLADVDRALDELARVLGPGGQLVYSVVHPRGGALGWSRTFESDEGPRAVLTYWHSCARLERACAQAQLAIDAVVEPRLPTGIANPPDGPVALVVRAVKQR
jgi:malonyl-CoA O-methyltransferase